MNNHQNLLLWNLYVLGECRFVCVLDVLVVDKKAKRHYTKLDVSV